MCKRYYRRQAYLCSPSLLLPLLRSSPLHDAYWTTVQQYHRAVLVRARYVGMRIHPRPVSIVMKILPSIKSSHISHVIVKR